MNIGKGVSYGADQSKTVTQSWNGAIRVNWTNGKRKRLIEAGSDLIIPDYCQMETLLTHLFGE